MLLLASFLIAALAAGGLTQERQTQVDVARDLLRRYTVSLNTCAAGDFAAAIRELREWPPDRIAVIQAVVRTELPPLLRWSPRQTKCAVLIHSELAVGFLRRDRLSADAQWHLKVAEELLTLETLSTDADFRLEWYQAAVEELNFARLYLEARGALLRARRRLAPSPALLFASGVTDEAIARLNPPVLTGVMSPQAVRQVDSARRPFLLDARKHFTAASRLAPADPRVQLHLGRVLALLDDEEAREWLERAVDAPDEETRYLAAMFLGGFHQQQKRLVEAAAWYERAMRLLPDASPAPLAYSQVLQQLGRRDAARRVLAEELTRPHAGAFGPWQNYPMRMEPDLQGIWLALRSKVAR